MLELPGGNVIDLSTDRSKYHALRRGGAGAYCGHKSLYPLVDVVYRKRSAEGMVKIGWTEYDYEYSGYTLDTIRQASDWSDADKDALFSWVRKPEQCQRIKTARRRLIDNQANYSAKSYSTPNHLYSLLRKRLQQLPMRSATATQWLATIENLKQHGVREEEINWSGLRHYLKQHSMPAVISKQVLLQQQHEGQQRIELSIERVWGENGDLAFDELVQRMPHQVVYRAALKLDKHCLCILRYVDRDFNYRVGVVKTLHSEHLMAPNKFWFALDPYGRAISSHSGSLFFENGLEAKTAANQHAQQHFGIHRGVRSHTQFDHLTLYGGNDYREWFISLPDYQRTFFGAHFFDHNLLAHIRTTSRTDTAGRKILFIEEVQSDWHQSGKRYGYDTSAWGRIANAPFKHEWAILAVKLMLIQASQNSYAGIAWATGSIQELRYQRYLNPVKYYYDRAIPQALNRLVKPFNCTVTSTRIKTREPWLNLERQQSRWRVADGEGKFRTRAKYLSREEAMAVIERHCRTIELEVPVLFISDALHRQISEKGLPLYGHTLE